MKRLMLIVSILTMALLCSCASTANIPKQIPDALSAACDTYTKAKPEVVKAREYAVAHWNDKVPGSDRDLIPAEVKTKLQDFDKFLPKLDAAGLAICSAAEAVDVFMTSPGEKVDWNELLTIVLKGASVAIDLKSKGVLP